ncbi:MAG: hypothetical protein ACOC6Q_03045, partial [Patescibacteria group bacterium]
MKEIKILRKNPSKRYTHMLLAFFLSLLIPFFWKAPQAFAVEYNESFESDFGDWENDPDNTSDWRRNSGGTDSSNTGPSSAQDGDYYIYVETSSGYSYSSGDTDIIEYSLSCGEGSGNIDFYFHQYGSEQGTLYLEGYDGSWNNLWSSTGDQGNQWNNKDQSFSDYTKLRFRNVAAGGWGGDIALDNITVTYTCNSAPSSPTSLETEGETNPTQITDTTPEFTAIYNDPDSGDVADNYQIQVDDNSDFSSVYWDSGKTAMSN